MLQDKYSVTICDNNQPRFKNPKIMQFATRQIMSALWQMRFVAEEKRYEKAIYSRTSTVIAS